MSAVPVLPGDGMLGRDVEVTIRGKIIGWSKFSDGERKYLVERMGGGKRKRQWFDAVILEKAA